MMKKNLQMCLRNWGKPTISNKEIKVIGRSKVRLNMLWRNKCLHGQIIVFNFTLVCTQSEDFFSKFKGHNSVKNYQIWAIYLRMERWKRATQYAPANLRWEYIKIYNRLHSSFICRVVKILKFLWKSTHKVWWMERLNGEIGWRDRGWGMKDTLYTLHALVIYRTWQGIKTKSNCGVCSIYFINRHLYTYVHKHYIVIYTYNGPSQTFIMHFKEPTGYIIRKKI